MCYRERKLFSRFIIGNKFTYRGWSVTKIPRWGVGTFLIVSSENTDTPTFKGKNKINYLCIVVRVSYALPSKKCAFYEVKNFCSSASQEAYDYFVPFKFINITKRETGKDLGFFASWLPSTLISFSRVPP